MASQLRLRGRGGVSALFVDPLGFDAGDSNLYRYVNNRATVATDPSGLQGEQFISPSDPDVPGFGKYISFSEDFVAKDEKEILKASKDALNRLRMAYVAISSPAWRNAIRYGGAFRDEKGRIAIREKDNPDTGQKKGQPVVSPALDFVLDNSEFYRTRLEKIINSLNAPFTFKYMETKDIPETLKSRMTEGGRQTDAFVDPSDLKTIVLTERFMKKTYEGKVDILVHEFSRKLFASEGDFGTKRVNPNRPSLKDTYQFEKGLDAVIGSFDKAAALVRAGSFGPFANPVWWERKEPAGTFLELNPFSPYFGRIVRTSPFGMIPEPEDRSGRDWDWGGY